MDHREPDHASIEQQYAPSHDVVFSPGSAFSAWAGGVRATVNSLHGQGVARLANGLTALGHAPDGLIEAFAVDGAQTFAYAVQWHPEWRCADNPFSLAMFRRSGKPAGNETVNETSGAMRCAASKKRGFHERKQEDEFQRS